MITFTPSSRIQGLSPFARVRVAGVARACGAKRGWAVAGWVRPGERGLAGLSRRAKAATAGGLDLDRVTPRCPTLNVSNTTKHFRLGDVTWPA